MNWKEKVKNWKYKDQWNELYEEKLKIRKPGEAVWASGNVFANSQHIIDSLPGIFKEYNIKSFLDIGCADFIWMQKVDFSKVKYYGVDIVDKLVEKNQGLYPDYDFQKMNVLKEIPRKVDLIFIRSVFIHMNLKQVAKAIQNIKASGSKYMMASTCTNLKENAESTCLMLKLRNLMEPPFNIGKPIKLLAERNDVKNDRYMGLWEL